MRLQGKEVTVEIGMGEERIQSHGYQLQDLVDQTLAGARKLLPLERVNSNKGTDEEREERKRDIFSNSILFSHVGIVERVCGQIRL